jgi:hypothetical protein
MSIEYEMKDDLSGALSVKFRNNFSLEQFCAENLDNFNPDRFEVLAIRLYFGQEPYVTMYAIDKDRIEGGNFDKKKIPVKKIKTDLAFLQKLLPLVDNINFTVSTGNFALEDMEVYNK